MRKLILATVLFSIAALSHASNPICDAKYSQSEKLQCYNYAVNGGLTRMKGNYKIIKNSSRISQDQKNFIDTNHAEWAKFVDNNCRDNVCVYGEVSRRNGEIESFMRQNKLTPM